MKKILRWFIYSLSFITIMMISLYAICFLMEAPDIKQNNYIKIYDSSSQVFYQSQNQSYVSIDNISNEDLKPKVSIEKEEEITPEDVVSGETESGPIITDDTIITD